MLTIKGLSIAYDRRPVLANLFLDVQPGKLYGVLGPNGAGKSTLFKVLLGLVQPDAGILEMDGKPLEQSRRRMVYVPQRGDIDWQFPATVFDVTLMGRYPHRRPLQRLSAEDRSIALKALEDMGILHLRDRQIGELSGGQQQRVFIARALCQQGDMLFFDEPFVGVDVTTEEKIMQILKRLRDEGKTVLVVHHDLSTVRQYFDSIILINQRLVACGETETTFTQENIAKTYGGLLTLLQ